MDKLLTIVIPVYNTEKYIKKCLDSLVVKKYLDVLDIIIISDGSPDNAVDIAKHFIREYPNTYRLIEKENGGHGSVINRGIVEAKGKYFKVLDSDDWFDTANFEQYLEKLSKLDVSLIITNSINELVYRNTQQKEDYYDLFEYEKITKVEDLDFKRIENVDIVSLANATFKTSILKESGIKLYEKCYYEDMQYDLFYLKYLKDFIVLDNYVYHYFIGRPEQSVSPKSALNHYDDKLRITLSLAEYLSNIINCNSKSTGKEWLANTLTRHIYVHYKFLLNMNTTDSVKKEKELKICLSKYPEVYDRLIQRYLFVRCVDYCPTATMFIVKILKKIFK